MPGIAKGMKGAAPSMWVWIIGGFLLALITIVILWQLISLSQMSFMRKVAEQQFISLNNEISFICSSSGVGSERSMGMRLPSLVEGIYASDNREYVPPDLAEVIDSPLNTPGISFGDNVCMKLRGVETLKCMEHDCAISMNYMGAPPSGSFFDQVRQLASSPTFDYSVQIKKTTSNQVSVEGARE